MTKTELLFIRACKSLNPEKRVFSVYKRYYYYSNKAYTREALISILANICDNYLDISVSRVIQDMYPHKFLNDNRTYNERAFDALVSWVRLTPVDTIDGYVAPVKFRNERNKR